MITKFVFSFIFSSIDIKFSNDNVLRKIQFSTKPIVIVSNHQTHLDTFLLKYIFLTYPHIYMENPYTIITNEFESIGYLYKLIAYTC